MYFYIYISIFLYIRGYIFANIGKMNIYFVTMVLIAGD